jgi:nicotinamidase-related amidase
MSGRAFLICDVWDRHWCVSAGERTAALAERIDAVAERLRRSGTFVIHAPAETMAFYEDSPQRTWMKGMPPASPPDARIVEEPGLSFDHGIKCPDMPECIEPEGPPWPWTRQHSAIRIGEEDGVTDDGLEVYRALKHLGIGTLYVAGIHTESCVLHRPFGIRQLRSWGVDCVLVSDLTEAFWPEDTEQAVQYIERHLCPTAESREL